MRLRVVPAVQVNDPRTGAAGGRGEARPGPALGLPGSYGGPGVQLRVKRPDRWPAVCSRMFTA